jgi:molybdopterin-guanine dinucleotide biosynthesis protein A
VLLAGGLARRMGGGDKPLRTIGGRSLLELVIERMRPPRADEQVAEETDDQQRRHHVHGDVVGLRLGTPWSTLYWRM